MTVVARGLILIVGAIGLLTGCGGGPGRATDQPVPTNIVATWHAGSTDLAFDQDLRYTCGDFAFEPDLLDRVGSAETGTDPMAVALREHLATPNMEVDWLPDTGWTLVGADAERAEFIAPSRDGGLDHVLLERGPNAWKVAGWGGCGPTLVIPDGLNIGQWLPDPAAPAPDDHSTTIHALVTERECASGQSSEGRVVGPAIAYEGDRVLVAFGVLRLEGDYFECPSNPSTPITFELAEPLGERELIDAARLPHVDVRTVEPFGY